MDCCRQDLLLSNDCKIEYGTSRLHDCQYVSQGFVPPREAEAQESLHWTLVISVSYKNLDNRKRKLRGHAYFQRNNLFTSAYTCFRSRFHGNNSSEIWL